MSNNTIKVTTETAMFVEVIVNGENKGKRRINGGPSLKEFVLGLGEEFGIRAFNVEVDGEAVTDSKASAPIAPNSTVSLSAKDSRGLADLAENTDADNATSTDVEGADDDGEEEAEDELEEALEDIEGSADGDGSEDPA